MKILVFTPVWKRPEITRAYCLGIQRLKKSFDVDVLCVLSPEDDSENKVLLDEYDIQYILHRNKLGEKKNEGLQHALKLDFDYLLEMNSDDIIADELLETYKDLMRKGENFIGIRNFVFYNSETGKSKQCKSTTLFGIGRAYKKEALVEASRCVDVVMEETVTTPTNYYKKGNWYIVHPNNVVKGMNVLSEEYNRLWDDTADRGMDNFSQGVFERVGILPTVIETPRPLAMDVKSEVNLWAFTDMPGESYDSKEILGLLSEQERIYLDGLRKNK
jgi:hypothetical protein